MTHQKSILKKLLAIREKVSEEKPLIHCITNSISINDCANVVLGVGAKPIMAEHPLEVAEITALSGALALNLGNITDSRMEAMKLSGKVARQKHIPVVLDLVGVGCSTLRRNYAKAFIAQTPPSVLKGNMSELKALGEEKSHASGVDVGDVDLVTASNLQDSLNLLKRLSVNTNAVVVATGVMDLIVCRQKAYVIKNGCQMLSGLTGTGCMINVMIATFISTGEILEGSLLAVALMGICGELSKQAKGNGTFKTLLLDNIYSLTNEDFIEKINLECYEI